MQIEATRDEPISAPLLDLFSTTQTNPDLYASFAARARQARYCKCTYNAPFFAYQIKLAHYGVTQGCCNHWDCKRCGVQRAREEYGRMVEGIRTLAATMPLYMLTITCQGEGESVEKSEELYGKRTNRFLTSFRSRVKRKGGQWHYVQVTERQKRRHPHSHFLTTSNPFDLYDGYVQKWKNGHDGNDGYKSVPALRSNWLSNALVKSELGEQYDVSLVRSTEGASRYCAKYLFKPSIFAGDWPKGWKRIRYSQDFPKLPGMTTDAFPLIDFHDWHLLSRRAAVVTVTDPNVLIDVEYHLAHGDTIVQLKSENSNTRHTVY